MSYLQSFIILLLSASTLFHVVCADVRHLASGLTLVEQFSLPPPPLANPAKVEVLGYQKSTNQNINRDLSFTTRIGNQTYYTYGDSRKCGVGVKGGCMYPSASDHVTLGSGNPLEVTDFAEYVNEKGYPQQFCKSYADEPSGNGQWAIGITSIIPVSETEGMLFYLVNHREKLPPVFPGAGVAQINITDGVPYCNRLSNNSATGHAREYWWNTLQEPTYGDHFAFLGRDGYIYAAGAMYKQGASDAVFLTRVPQQQYADFNSYEYWHGNKTGWTTERLINPTDDQAFLHLAGQGTVIFSPHLNSYMMFYGYAGGMVGRRAYHPEGPWSEGYSVIDGDCKAGCSYTPVAQPWWDETGASLVLSYTEAGTLNIKVHNITWEDWADPALPNTSPWYNGTDDNPFELPSVLPTGSIPAASSTFVIPEESATPSPSPSVSASAAVSSVGASSSPSSTPVFVIPSSTIGLDDLHVHVHKPQATKLAHFASPSPKSGDSVFENIKPEEESVQTPGPHVVIQYVTLTSTVYVLPTPA